MYTELAKKYIPEDDVYLFNTGNAEKAWLLFGCHYIPEIGMHRFVVWAPNAEAVSLVGNFNAWDSGKTPMQKFGSIWCCFVADLKDGELYKYAVTQKGGKVVFKSDPFARYSQSGINTASIVREGSHKWSDGEWMRKRQMRDPFASPMSIYELHLGSWRIHEGSELPDYESAAMELSSYCAKMGFTHVELLPMTEYPFPGSWGYQVTGYFAPTSRYGDPDAFAAFVDILHAHGIGVIMDWVPAHFPRDEHGLACFDGTPLFECKEERMASHPEWGTLIFDYAMPEVQSFLISSACFFFEEYHIDGIRVDAVSSMLYLNYCRKDGEYTPNKFGGDINLDAVSFLRRLNTAVLSRYPGAITVAEESTAYPMVTMPPSDGGLGFSFKWDMGYMHDTLDYFSADPLYRKGLHDKLTFSMMYAFSENFILAFSHDEVVHGKKSMLDKMYGSYEQKFATLRALYGYQFAHPGKKLCFMGSEFGQFIEWNYKQELDWLLLKYPAHDSLREYYSQLNHFYAENPELYEVDKSWDGFSWLNVGEKALSCIAFMRSGRSHSRRIICVCNFIPNANPALTIGLPSKGRLRLLLSSDEPRFGGEGGSATELVCSSAVPFEDMPHSAVLSVPPLSCLYYEFIPAERSEK